MKVMKIKRLIMVIIRMVMIRMVMIINIEYNDKKCGVCKCGMYNDNKCGMYKCDSV